ncbi:MAG: hypothetical protein K8T25_22530 [Planctomycetia bacterium]|nr:hypothetical protein [Planctomycetia bacterium]
METNHSMDQAHRFQGGQIRREIARPSAARVASLARFSTSLLSDCLDHLAALDPALRSMTPAVSFAGGAVTVEEIEGGNLMSHLALSLVEPGDVLVISAQRVTTRATWGGLQSLSASKKGVVAVLVDGAVRDVNDARKLNMPLFARGTSPAGPHKAGGGRINCPTSCGGQVIQPGDVVVGDADGIVVVPAAEIDAVLLRAAARAELEAAWFKNVERGENTADFLGLKSKMQDYGIREV